MEGDSPPCKQNISDSTYNTRQKAKTRMRHTKLSQKQKQQKTTTSHQNIKTNITQNTCTNQGSQRKIIKQICEGLPDIGISIPVEKEET